MQYLIYLSWYLMIGMVVQFLLDWIHSKVVSIKGGENFTHLEKFMLTILWPIYLITFIVNFFKGWGSRP